MVAPRVKPEFGPTLPELVQQRRRRGGRRVVVGLATLAACVALAGAAIAVYLLRRPHVHFNGPVPFHFRYTRALHRVTPDPGGYVRLEHVRDGRLVISMAVGPLHLPPYRGQLGGELPLFAAGYIRALAARRPGFALQAEGRGRLNVIPDYSIAYSARLNGRPVYGRDLLVLPDRPHVRDGVVIAMLARPSSQAPNPQSIGLQGDLFIPLRTFAFGA